MKNKVTIKLILTCIIMLFIIIISTNSYADSSISGTVASISGGGSGAGQGMVEGVGGVLLDIAQGAAAAVAAIMLAMLGIKYVQASPNERADIKKHAVVYFVGAVLAFGGIPIVRFMAEIASGWN